LTSGSKLPQGTVTFTFTDIEGSTALLKRLGDEYAAVLSTHRRLVRESLAACGGVEIDTQGDAFFAAFGRARDAVDAVARIQSAHVAETWAQGTEVRVRIGLHTGEPTLSDEGYLGLDVVRAARLCGAARGGQVLMSQVTRSLVGSALPEGAKVQLLGERELKDIDEPEIVYELTMAGVEVTPAPATPATLATLAPREPSAESVAPPTPAGKRKRKGKGKVDDAGSRFDARMDEWGARLEEAILKRVGRSLDRARPDAPPETAAAARGADQVEGVGAMVTSITAQLDAQLSALFAEIDSEEVSRPRAEESDSPAGQS
jgi:class 3 adenylate cyclase